MSRQPTSPEQFLSCYEAARQLVARYRSEAPPGCDPQNSFIAVGVTAAATIGAAYMTYSAQEDATNANRKNISDTNALNYQMFRQARGEGGSAILPLYMPQGTEAKLGGDALNVYDAVTGQPVQMTLDQYNQILQQMNPAVQGGNNAINSIYNGGLQTQRLNDLAPVLQARTAAANTNAGAVDLSAQQEQNRIAAQNAAKGYVGSDNFNNTRMLQSLLAARQQAAQIRGQANIANATDTRGVNDQSTALKLSSLDLPIQRAGQLIQLSQAPAQGLVARQALAMQPLNFFKLNPGNPPQAQTFQQQPNSFGGPALSGVAQLAGGYANYQMNQQNQQAIINAINQQNAGTPYGRSTGDWANEAMY